MFLIIPVSFENLIQKNVVGKFFFLIDCFIGFIKDAYNKYVMYSIVVVEELKIR